MVVHRCVERGVCAVGRWCGGRERDEKAESLRNQKVLEKAAARACDAQSHQWRLFLDNLTDTEGT